MNYFIIIVGLIIIISMLATCLKAMFDVIKKELVNLYSNVTLNSRDLIEINAKVDFMKSQVDKLVYRPYLKSNKPFAEMEVEE